jgi:AbiU2
MDDIDKHIEELRGAVEVASLNYEIWRTYNSPETRPEYVNTMNVYTLFFQTSIHAHFVALLVALYRLYETRLDTYNIPTLIKLLDKQSSIPAVKIAEIKSSHEITKPIWVKVCILRNNAFAHQSAASELSEIFKKADVTPDQQHELVESTKKLLNQASHAWAKTRHAFNLDARDDTLRLLQDLKTYNKGMKTQLLH